MDFTEIFVALISLATAVVIYVLAPTVKAFLQERVEREKLEKWKALVDTAVAAAEQKIEPELFMEKKEYVQAWLQDRGIVYDEETVDNMIEAAVIRLHNELQKGVKTE